MAAYESMYSSNNIMFEPGTESIESIYADDRIARLIEHLPVIRQEKGTLPEQQCLVSLTFELHHPHQNYSVPQTLL